MAQFVIRLNLQMAGGMFTHLDNLCRLDCSNIHPQICHLCHEHYQHLCLLDCYHIFCELSMLPDQ